MHQNKHGDTFENGTHVTMRCKFLRDTGQYFDSPQHHRGKVIEEPSENSALVRVRWEADWDDELTGGVHANNLIRWDRRHLEPA